MSTDAAYGNEMEITLFTDALRAAVPTQPSRELTTTIVPRLAAAARSATIEAETAASRRPATWVRSRRALVAKVAVAVASVPLLLAGLAFAGVTVPAPARDAFESVGITLPNQHSGHSSATETTRHNGQGTAPKAAGGNDVSSTAHTKPKGKGGNSGAAHEYAKAQHEKAQGEAMGHDRGKAIGLNESTPPGQSGQTGPPAHSNAGGNDGGSSASHPKAPSPVKPAPVKPPLPTPEPNGEASGQMKTPQPK